MFDVDGGEDTKAVADAIAENKALEKTIAAYRKKRITRATMVARVRAVVEQYDALSRSIEYEYVERELGESIDEFWADGDDPDDVGEDDEDGWGVDEDDAADEDDGW